MLDLQEQDLIGESLEGHQPPQLPLRQMKLRPGVLSPSFSPSSRTSQTQNVEVDHPVSI